MKETMPGWHPVGWYALGTGKLEEKWPCVVCFQIKHPIALLAPMADLTFKGICRDCAKLALDLIANGEKA